MDLFDSTFAGGALEGQPEHEGSGPLSREAGTGPIWLARVVLLHSVHHGAAPAQRAVDLRLCVHTPANATGQGASHESAEAQARARRRRTAGRMPPWR